MRAIEGAPDFAPARLDLFLRRGSRERPIRAEVRGRYDSAAQAEAAKRRLDVVRVRVADSIAARLAGVARPVGEAHTRVDGETLIFETTLTAAELRLIAAAAAALHVPEG